MPDEAGDTWDVIIIDGGPPGENVAQYAIQGSDRTAVIVEAELAGGESSCAVLPDDQRGPAPAARVEALRRGPGVSAIGALRGVPAPLP